MSQLEATVTFRGHGYSIQTIDGEGDADVVADLLSCIEDTARGADDVYWHDGIEVELPIRPIGRA